MPQLWIVSKTVNLKTHPIIWDSGCHTYYNGEESARVTVLGKIVASTGSLGVHKCVRACVFETVSDLSCCFLIGRRYRRRLQCHSEKQNVILIHSE